MSITNTKMELNELMNMKKKILTELKNILLLDCQSF